MDPTMTKTPLDTRIELTFPVQALLHTREGTVKHMTTLTSFDDVERWYHNDCVMYIAQDGGFYRVDVAFGDDCIVCADLLPSAWFVKAKPE